MTGIDEMNDRLELESVVDAIQRQQHTSSGPRHDVIIRRLASDSSYEPCSVVVLPASKNV